MDTVDQYDFTPNASRKLLGCILGSAILVGLFFAIPWPALWATVQPLVATAIESIKEAIASFDYVISLLGTLFLFCVDAIASFAYVVSSLVWMSPKIFFASLLFGALCLFCIHAKGVLNGLKHWQKKATFFFPWAVLAIWFSFFFMAVSWISMGNNSEVATDPQHDYVKLMKDQHAELNVMGPMSRFSSEIKDTGTASRNFGLQNCQNFARTASSATWLEMKVNGKPASVANCRIGRNTVVWTRR